MRILHLSDFHLSNNVLEQDKAKMMVLKIIEAIKPYNKEKKIDFIFFSGDAVNQGGKSFGDINLAFSKFLEIFIKPLISALGLDKSHFIMSAGNHDIDRDADPEMMDVGVSTTCKDEESVEDFLSKPTWLSNVRRIQAFYDFEKSFYGNNTDCLNITPLQSCFKFREKDKVIGICCLNSAWRCYRSSNDKDHILMGCKQIKDSLPFLSDCDVKIAMSHHHYSWMCDFEKDELDKLIISNFDMYLCGHTHSSNEELTIRSIGKTFKIVASGILSHNFLVQDKYENGFSIIDYDTDVYKFIQTKFAQDLTGSFYEQSTWKQDIPCGEEAKARMQIQEIVLDTKRETEELNKHLLTYKNGSKAPKRLTDIFVMPTLTMREEHYQADLERNDFKEVAIDNIQSLLKSDKNYMIFGIKESGKTILLDRILIEALKFSVDTLIPIPIDFSERGNDVFLKIKKYWCKSKQETEKMLKKGNFLLIIDNVSFSDEENEKLDNLKDFLDSHTNIRYVGACLERRSNDVLVDAEQQAKFNYVRLELQEFRSKQLRELVSKWFANQGENEEKIDLLVKTFSRLNLPCTPFAISMFLYIFEKQGDIKARNLSMLIENYLHDLLKTLDKPGAPSDIFDYKNRMRLMAHIAVKMLKSNEVNYQISYWEYNRTVEDYLMKMSFDKIYSPSKIANDFIKLGIMIKEKNDKIHFRFSCFFEFSLAFAMHEFPKFKDFVLQENNYLNFVNEISYYTGLYRSENEILEMILSRMDKDYVKVNEIVFEEERNVDNSFNNNFTLLSRIDSGELLASLPKKQTVEDKEKSDDIKLSHLHKSPDTIERKEAKNQIQEYSRQLMLAMNVLRNSEEITKEGLKFSSYVKVLRHSISYALLFHSIVTYMIERIKVKLQEKDIPEERLKDLNFVIHCLPVIHECVLKDNLSSFKLSEILLDKIKEDIGNLQNKNSNKDYSLSEFERFLSVFLYCDVKGARHKEVLKDFLSSFNRMYIADACLLKLLEYYSLSKDKEYDDFLIDSIANLYLKIKGKGDRDKTKGKIIEHFKALKDKLS